MFDNRLSGNPLLCKHRVCFTGHRPTKLRQSEEEIKGLLKREIIKSIEQGYYVFVSGMCFGVDIWAAEIVIDLRKEMPDLKLVCAIPFYGVQETWTVKWQKRFNEAIKQCDFFTFGNMKYENGIFNLRNRWMVDRSAKLIAVFNGSPGGTYDTIKYARSKKLDVTIIRA